MSAVLTLEGELLGRIVQQLDSIGYIGGCPQIRAGGAEQAGCTQTCEDRQRGRAHRFGGDGGGERRVGEQFCGGHGDGEENLGRQGSGEQGGGEDRSLGQGGGEQGRGGDEYPGCGIGQHSASRGLLQQSDEQ